METYDTHDNGGRAFRVKISENKDGTKHLVVRRMVTRRSRPMFQIDVNRVLVGKSTPNHMTSTLVTDRPEYDGNSILVELSDLVYLHIGRTILEFRTKSSVSRYESPVGNNDVPYPYAVDIRGNYYLPIENVILLTRPGLSEEAEGNGNDPYTYYYAHGLMSVNFGRVPPLEPIDGPYRGIQFMTVGQEKYYMTYHPDAGEVYDRLTSEDNGPMFIYYDDETVEQMTRESYIRLMKEFGKDKGFERMDVIKETA